MKIGLKNVEKMTIKYKLWSGMGNVGTIIISK
jgi:multidrug transporter EmrE-like cation transporter